MLHHSSVLQLVLFGFVVVFVFDKGFFHEFPNDTFCEFERFRIRNAEIFRSVADFATGIVAQRNARLADFVFQVQQGDFALSHFC